MKCLVTGGAGFIGSHLIRALCARDTEVIVLDDFSTGRLEHLKGLPVTIVEGDIRDAGCVTAAVQGADAVFHLAARCSVQHSVEDPLGTHAVNATGTLNVLEASRHAGVRRVIFASSSTVYGDSESLLKQETMPTVPLSPYAVSKLAGENFCRLYSQLYGLETVVLRYFNVFGPRQNPDSDYAAVIPRFLAALMNQGKLEIHGDGMQSRDFTYVDNVIDATVAAAFAPAAAGQVLNVACGERWSLLELINSLEMILQCDMPLQFRARRPADIHHSQASIERARRVLGYAPVVDVEQGIKKTVSWYFAAEVAAMRPPPVRTGSGLL